MLNCKRYSFPGLQNDCLHTCSLLGVGFYVIFGPFWGDQCVGQSHPGKSVSNRSGLFQLGAARYLSLRGAGDHWKTVITVLSCPFSQSCRTGGLHSYHGTTVFPVSVGWTHRCWRCRSIECQALGGSMPDMAMGLLWAGDWRPGCFELLDMPIIRLVKGSAHQQRSNIPPFYTIFSEHTNKGRIFLPSIPFSQRNSAEFWMLGSAS